MLGLGLGLGPGLGPKGETAIDGLLGVAGEKTAGNILVAETPDALASWAELIRVTYAKVSDVMPIRPYAAIGIGSLE
jgi:hypothetical protein